MKEKRILAMFITSAVTLVASLAVTFGVFMTLADPVVATGVTRYQFSFNSNNNSLIAEDGSKLSLKNEIVYQPSCSVIWSEEEGEELIYFNDMNGSLCRSYEDDFLYADESLSAKIKAIPVRLSNNYDKPIYVNLKVTFDTSKTLGQYTYIKLYNLTEHKYTNLTNIYETIALDAGSHADYVIVVYTDESTNTSLYNQINYKTDSLKLNVVVENTTIFG